MPCGTTIGELKPVASPAVTWLSAVEKSVWRVFRPEDTAAAVQVSKWTSHRRHLHANRVQAMPRQRLIRDAKGVLAAGNHVRSIKTKRMASQSEWNATGAAHGYVQLPRLDHANLLRHRCEDHFDAQMGKQPAAGFQTSRDSVDVVVDACRAHDLLRGSDLIDRAPRLREKGA